MRPPRLSCLAVSACVSTLASAASLEDRLELLSRPPIGKLLALSPDGHRVAYTTQTATDTQIVMVNVEQPDQRRIITVESAPEGTAAAENRTPVELRFLRWASNTRLVYAPVVREVPLPPITDKQGRTLPNPDGPTVIAPIMATDADGRQRGTLVDARDFQEAPEDARRTLADFLRSPIEMSKRRKDEPVRWRMPRLEVLGFFPRDRDQLIVGTHGAYSLPMRHLVDIRTGHVQAFGEDWPAPPGEPQVYDWHRLKVVGERRDAALPATAWHDADLEKLQRMLAAKFPRRAVEILDWSETRARVLLRVTGGTDPGRVFVYQRTEDVAVEIMRRAPWLTGKPLHETRHFEFAAADGATLSGWLTWPEKAAAPPPLVLVFPPRIPGPAHPAFDPEAQVFADLGFAVARLNPRAIAGARPADEPAPGDAFDRVAVADGRAAIDWLAARPARAIDRGRVAALGRGLGARLAGHAVQLEPAVFRAGVAIGSQEAARSTVLPIADPGAGAAARASAYRRIAEFLQRHVPGPAAAATEAP
ncbi:MAG: hypothetical protein JNL39_08775 [Opitutaceae bacterium]|nr:hypothetical protein [Opitutaceae bacterium]